MANELCRGIPEDIAEALAFWTRNSYQHAEMMIEFYEGSEAVVEDYFRDELYRLLEVFRTLSERAQKEGLSFAEERTLANDYTVANYDFLTMMNRLKFEGINGYPYLMMLLSHIVYEQRYTNGIFSYAGAQNNNYIYGQSEAPSNCLYAALYFFSIINAQHPSILLTIEPFTEAITEELMLALIGLINAFNAINFRLSSLGNNVSDDALLPILEDFQKENRNLLSVLERILNAAPGVYRNGFAPEELPSIFYMITQHFIEEQQLAEQIEA